MAEKYIVRSAAIASRLLGEEMMVMSTTDSTFFSLNAVATKIWQNADGKTPLREIVARKICRDFDVNPEDAHRDADYFVDELAQHGILRVSDRPMADSRPGPE